MTANCLTFLDTHSTLRMLDGAGSENGSCRVTPPATIPPVGPCRVPARSSFHFLRARHLRSADGALVLQHWQVYANRKKSLSAVLLLAYIFRGEVEESGAQSEKVCVVGKGKLNRRALHNNSLVRCVLRSIISREDP
jgi:hypothetical protein